MEAPAGARPVGSCVESAVPGLRPVLERLLAGTVVVVASASVVVEALGFREDVRQQMRSACVLCLSSKSEAFPVSLIEGLAEGLVCVSTDVGDCRHIIGACGATVPRERPDLLADALEQWTTASHQERERWASRCVRRARDLFSVTQMGRIYTATLFPGLEGKVI